MTASTNLHACNCFAARQAARHITKLYERHLAQAGLTSTQFSILALLHERPGIGMRAMTEALVMDRTSLLRALKPMQRDGLVTTGGDAGMRGNRFSASAAGMERLRAAVPLWERAQAEFEREVGADAAARLREVSLAVSGSAGS